jgi:HlyD family secretion protein
MSASRLGLFAMLAAGALLLAGCGNGREPVYQGWVEADLLFVGPDEAGRIEALSFREGDAVEKGALIFTLDSELQTADVNVARANEVNARQAYERAAELLKRNAGTQKALEDAQAALRSAQARLNAAETRLSRRRVFSPDSGRIQQVYYRVGEIVAAGRAVVALLPPGNVKVRFYVPEAVLPTIKVGDDINVRCDGCTELLAAKINFIARTAEFTPPVIYSQEERSKLVFLVEARPAEPEKLRIGQPVSVELNKPGHAK